MTDAVGDTNPRGMTQHARQLERELKARTDLVEQLKSALEPFAKYGHCTCWPWVHDSPTMKHTDPDFNRFDATAKAIAALAAAKEK